MGRKRGAVGTQKEPNMSILIQDRVAAGQDLGRGLLKYQ